jgi:hypothetical protein
VKILVDYAEAKLRHPQEVAAAVRALRASASKHKAEAPSKLEWSYDIAVEVRSVSIQTLMSNQFRDEIRKQEKKSVEELVQDQLSRSRAVLMASKGHWRHAITLEVTPPEWERRTRSEVVKSRHEQAAYEALPAAEKEIRKQGALAAAKRQGGFFVSAKTDKESK